MFRTRSVFIGAVLAAGVAATTLTASALPVGIKPLDEAQMRAVSLKISDIPSDLLIKGQTPARVIDYVAGKRAPAPDLCITKKGDTVYGKKPRQWMESNITLKEDLGNFSFVATNSDIYQYANAKRALKAYDELRTMAMECSQTTRAKVKDDGAKVKVKVKGKFKNAASIGGVRGFALSFDLNLGVDVPDKIDLALLADQYSVYHLSGTSIVRVEYAQVDGDKVKKIGKPKRQYTKSASRTVTYRVWDSF